MSKRATFGIIGCGVIGKTHCQAAAGCPDAELLAVADLIPERAAEMQRQHAVPRVYDSGAKLLADPDIAAVVLALPAVGRFDLALQAFAVGKHVLTEKPVAMDAAQVRRLIAARGRLTAGCCSSRYRFLSSSVAIESFLASGALGALRLVRARGVVGAGPAPASGVTPPDWRLKRALNGGGILMNWGCYDLDYVLGLTGWTLRPNLALGCCWPLAPHLTARATPGSEAETHGIALVQCDGGVALSFERAEFGASATDNAHQFIGEKGALRTVLVPTGRKSVYHDHTDPQFGLLTRTLWEADDPYEPVMSGPVRDFASAIARGHAPKTTLEQALVVQQITDAIYASSARGCAVACATSATAWPSAAGGL